MKNVSSVRSPRWSRQPTVVTATHGGHGVVIVGVDRVPGMLFHLFILFITTVVHSEQNFLRFTSQLKLKILAWYSILKKHLNTSRPSEHPPVRGKMSKRLGGIMGCKDKTSSWHLNGFPDGSKIGSTV